MGWVQSNLWGDFVDDQLTPGDLGAQVAGRVNFSSL